MRLKNFKWLFGVIATTLILISGLQLNVAAKAITNSEQQSYFNSQDKVPVKSVFYKDAKEFAQTYDKTNAVSDSIHQEAFELYKIGKWSELESLFKKNNLNGGWPPANGGFNIIDDVELKAGMKFDRYSAAIPGWDGKGAPPLGGNFTSPLIDGTSYPFGERALNKQENTYDFYFEIEILKDLPFKGQTADIIPWFGQPGFGKQTMWKIPVDAKTGYPKTWNKLAEEGYIKITIKNSPSKKYLDKVNLVIK